MIENKPYKKRQRALLHALPEILLFAVFCIIQLQHINLDLWNDEIYTLKQFTFVSIQKTLIDYHVPNNHILFNLINNLYLRLIQVDSLHSLMSTPYKLRVIPFVYSLLTVVFTYKIALKHFNRIIALTAATILITTIPYFNFALQIRGYGLSMLLLVLVTYFSLSYLKSKKKLDLALTSLITTLIIYTTPSNVYSLFSILLTFGIYALFFSLKKIKRQKSFKVKIILIDPYVHLSTAMVIGVFIALALYSPIFHDVFMNDYIKSGTPFVFSKLTFYSSQVFYGMISNRWALAVLSLFGLMFAIKGPVKWRLLITISITSCIIPILLTYVRGDNAPLRVFIVLAPFFSTLFAVGLYYSWRLLLKRESIFDYALIVIVSIYSLTIFNQEITHISDYVFTDIKESRRSQNLYYQYYSWNYHPLSDITEFKETYNPQLPIIILGCEPHGVSNYLEKFKVPYYHQYFQPNALDSLLGESDSIYIITNHAYFFNNLKEYEVKTLNKELSYHNTLLLSKSKHINKIYSNLDSLSSQYKDSIAFIFNTYNANTYNHFISSNSCYVISEANKTCFGELIEFTKSKPYLCYLETFERNSTIINSIVKHGCGTINSLDSSINTTHFYLTSKGEEGKKTDTEVYFNNYEQTQNNKDYADKLIDSAFSFSGTYSEKLDASHQFSTGFSHTVSRDLNNFVLEASFVSRFNKDSKALIVLNITRNNESVIWIGNKVNEFFNPNTEWQQVISSFLIKETLKPNDLIHIYVWNPEKENIWIDDFKIDLIEQAK